MEASPFSATAQEFARYAGSDVARWQALLNTTVTHYAREGVFRVVRGKDFGELKLEMFYTDGNGSLRVPVADFSGGRFFATVTFPPAVIAILEQEREHIRVAHEAAQAEEKRRADAAAQKAERRRREAAQRAEELAAESAREREATAAADLQRQQELRARNEFADRKARYQADSHHDTSLVSPLFAILLRLENGECPTPDGLKWLKQHRLHATLAMYLELAYHWDGKEYRLSSACRAWREAKQPKKALALTDRLLDMPQATERKFRAIILTARGGALRDMHIFSDAEECAWGAIHCDETHHPHNLLGAIYFQLGQPEEGYYHFLKAKELNPRPSTEKYQMEGPLKQSGVEEQRAVAEYLLKKDPVRYSWAKWYLSPTSGPHAVPDSNHSRGIV